MTILVNLLKASPLVWIYAHLNLISSNFGFGAYVLSFLSLDISIITRSHYGLRSYMLSFQSSWLLEFEVD